MSLLTLAFERAKKTFEKRPHEPSFGEICAYSATGVGDTLISVMLGGFASSILVLGLKVDPLYLGFIATIKMGVDAITDPTMGHISDNWKGKEGRRRPFILWGGILVSLFFFLTWLLPTGLSQMGIVYYFAAGVIMYSICHTVYAVPYVALGMELSPSYNGKTRLYVWKHFFTRFATGFVSPWLYTIALLPIFASSNPAVPTEVVGARWIAGVVAIFMILGTVMVYRNCKERAHFHVRKKQPFLSSVLQAVRNVNFLKITGLYVLMLIVLGLFAQITALINVLYVFAGDKAAGAMFTAGIETLAGVLVLLALPVVSFLCKRVGKHNALKIAFGLMIVGDIVKWWAFTPEYKHLQWLLPFCYSLGISSIFVVLESLMADVIDYDQLKTGFRREGIFGAASGFMMKSAGAIAASASGVLLAVVGYNADLLADQSEATFFWLRAFNSLVPAAMLGIAFLILYKYPLTEAVMTEVREILDSGEAPGKDD
jgi:GPH family glycoside/pentoside/hexuronide:cation symporter